MTFFVEPKKKSEMNEEFVDYSDIVHWAIMGKRISMALRDKGMQFNADENNPKELERKKAFDDWK